MRLVLLGALSALLVVGSAASGQTDFTWTGIAGDGLWSSGANRDDGGDHMTHGTANSFNNVLAMCGSGMFQIDDSAGLDWWPVAAGNKA